MISFIVPAHNEQAGLGRTLQAIHDAARAAGQPYEIIVVDDASTDATADIARRHQSTVLPVNHRQIAATRNSGARAANGSRLFFVDADTTINPRAVASALRCLDQGAVGGGSPVKFDGVVPLYARLISFLSVIGTKLAGSTGGAFMFCTRDAFQDTGGFDERLFCGEEVAMVLALKREGRFVVLWDWVLTSGRRVRAVSGLQVLALVARVLFSPVKFLTRRSSVQNIWYDSNREADEIMPGSLAVRVSNGIALLVVLAVISAPIWFFIPWSLTPLAGPLGKIRFVITMFLGHVGLVFWPYATFLFVSLIRSKRRPARIRLALSIAVCLWLAWLSTNIVIWTWTRLALFVTHV